MWKRSTCSLLLMALVALALGSAAQGAFSPLSDPTLVGWWTCDDGAGTAVADSSPNKRNGTVVNGAATWVPGMHAGAIELKLPVLVQIPAVNISMTQATMAGWLKRIGSQADWSSIMMTRGSATGFNLVANQLAYHWADSSATWGARPTAPIPDGEWTFCAVTVDPAKAVFYLNGAQVFVNTAAHGAVNWNADIFLGGDGTTGFPDRRLADGMLDDVSLFSRALTADEIKVIMKGLSDPALAGSPTPADGATDVLQDASLSWKPGDGATAHNVYLGKSFADVNSASATSPKGVLASANQTETTYTPAALLDFGQTYFWRVDEVGAGVLKGNVWSFTAEPFAYPITGITATASSSQPSMGPDKTIDGSGMTGDLHGVDTATMWMSKGTLPNWIQYEFNAVYKLDKLMVWNSNQQIEAFIGFGAKDVTVEYSVDGVTWTTLVSAPQFSRAPGSAGYAANTTVDFAGAMAKSVKLTINKTWGGIAATTGLAEVRFTYIPVRAFTPKPAVAATGVSINTDLNWRPGREAKSHVVNLGTNQNALVQVGAPTDHSFTPAALNFATTYYWQVNEVGGAGPYDGQVWSFTTQEYATIDDIESYNDDDNRIYDSWVDGLTDAAKGGSQVGYDVSPFAEKATIHGGAQAMPLKYNNATAPFVSEADQVFATPQNWTTSGADTLSLFYQGSMPAFAELPSGNVLMNAIGADIWNTADEFRFAYKTLTGNGTMVARVESIANSNAWAKGGVMIRASVEPASTHAFMPITPGGSGAGNGASFQHRLTVGGASTNADNTGAVVAAPYWVKIERTGNSFTGSISPDGKTWTALGTPQTIVMNGPVLIGLALCSHTATASTGAEFSNISFTGNVTGNWTVAEIGVAQPAGNSAEGLYVTVKDSSGKSKTVTNSDTAATVRPTWQQWKIPLSDFTSAGVKMNAVKSLTIGVGNRTSPVKGGTGTLFLDDIGFGTPAAQ